MNKRLSKYTVLLLALLAAWPLNTLAAGMGEVGVNVLCALVAGLWLGCAIWFGRRGRRTEYTAAHLIHAAAFAAGLIFVFKLHHQFSWHDLAGYNPDFSGEAKPDGHLGFIAYLVENARLPLEYDPHIEGYSVFYNPPLHHIVHACFMKLNLLLGLPVETALENLQLITLACATACGMITADLIRFLGVRERGVRVGALLMAFQPTMLIFGATVNNDIQTVMLLLACILFTVRWQRSRAMRDILLCGVTLGAAMATKLSAALIIPCIAMVFAVAFFRDLRRWKRYIGQFAAFLTVSVPEAVAWPLFHLIAYQMPLNYVRLPAETINVSAYTLWQRFGIPDGKAIRGLFYSGIRKIDHNVWMQTLKTGMFDELTLFQEGTVMWYAAYLSLVLFAVLLLVSLGLFIRWLVVNNAHADGMTKAFLASYGGLLIVNYLQFCLQYPYICTFNFRYIMPVLSLCALAFAAYTGEGKRSWWAAALAALFAAMVLLVYGMYFFG